MGAQLGRVTRWVRAWVYHKTHGSGHGSGFDPIEDSDMGLTEADPVKPDPIARLSSP